MSKETKKVYYENNKEKLIQYQIDRYQELSLKFNNWRKTLKCSRCEESDYACLEFHHCNPSEKEMNIRKMVARGIKSVLSELKKCVVLCANCHSKVHVYKIETKPDETLSKKFETF